MANSRRSWFHLLQGSSLKELRKPYSLYNHATYYVFVKGYSLRLRNTYVANVTWAITILMRVRGKVRGWVQFCTCLMGNTYTILVLRSPNRAICLYIH